MEEKNNQALLRTEVEKSSPPVFVIGSARSGTSILSRLIRDYLKVSFGTESQFIVRVFKRLGRYGDLRQGRNLGRLLSDLQGERCFQRWKKFGFSFDPVRICGRLRKKSYSGLLEAIFMDLAIHNKMHRWGDKTPEYINDLDVLLRLFPNAKFVHIVRDGRDVALSTFQTHFGAKNIGEAALAWNKQMASVEAFKKTAGPCQLIEIKYEEFIEKPVETFYRLIDFLEIDDPDGSIETNVRRNIASELFQGNYFKWKTRLSRKEQTIFEKVNYEYLRKWGYPTVTDGSLSVRPLEKFYWRFDNAVKRLARLDIWKDNLYKLKVRLRYLGKGIKRNRT